MKNTARFVRLQRPFFSVILRCFLGHQENITSFQGFIIRKFELCLIFWNFSFNLVYDKFESVNGEKSNLDYSNTVF
jgi:hypothetical protein